LTLIANCSAGKNIRFINLFYIQNGVCMATRAYCYTILDHELYCSRNKKKDQSEHCNIKF